MVTIGLAASVGFSQQSYRGFYAGSLVFGGNIGFYVNANSDVTVIVIDPLSNSFGADTTVKITPTGSFTGTFSDTTITGQIAANGSVTGTVAPVGISFTARRAPLSGPTLAYEGFYQGWVTTPENRQVATSLAVSADGQLSLFIQAGGQVVDAGYGTIDSSGSFSVKDSRGRVSAGSIGTTAGGLAWNGKFTKTGVGAYTFIVGRRTAANKLINISTRGKVETGDGVMTVGFAIDGGAKTVRLRGLGPGLALFNVANTLVDPQLALYFAGQIIATNDNWGNAAATTTAAEITAVTTRIGAFALTPNSLDAVLLMRLEPGSYSAQLSGANGGTGFGLIEVWEVQ